MNDEQTMKDKIAEAIEENLPNQVGKLLQKKLADAEVFEARGKELVLEIKNTRLQLKTSQNEVNRLGALKAERDDLKELRKVLEIEKQIMKEAVLTIKLAEANKRADCLNNLVGLLMKNPQAVTSMFTSFNDVNVEYNPDGSQIIKHPGSSKTEITHTNEKS